MSNLLKANLCTIGMYLIGVPMMIGAFDGEVVKAIMVTATVGFMNGLSLIGYGFMMGHFKEKQDG